MSSRSEKFATLIESFQGSGLDAHYLGYFECFNQRRFFEAHEVLEQLWLQQRKGPRDLFYKGLIQLAGAFVHLQKGRGGPAMALLRLARANLAQYPAVYDRLEVTAVCRHIDDWLHYVEALDGQALRFCADQVPKLALLTPAA